MEHTAALQQGQGTYGEYCSTPTEPRYVWSIPQHSHGARVRTEDTAAILHDQDTEHTAALLQGQGTYGAYCSTPTGPRYVSSILRHSYRSKVRMEDTAAILRGQGTEHTAALLQGQGLYGAYCSAPKGQSTYGAYCSTPTGPRHVWSILQRS